MERDHKVRAAREAYLEVRSQEPENRAAQDGIERCNAALAEADRILNEAERELGEEGYYLYAPGSSFPELRRRASATEERIRSTLMLVPDSARARTLLGRTLAILAEPDRAEQSFREAIRLDPQDPLPRLHLVQLWIGEGVISLFCEPDRGPEKGIRARLKDLVISASDHLDDLRSLGGDIELEDSRLLLQVFQALLREDNDSVRTLVESRLARPPEHRKPRSWR